MKRAFNELRNLALSWIGGMILCTAWMYFVNGISLVDIYQLFVARDVPPIIALIGCLVSYPYRFGGNIYSLWGGVNQDGDVYSLVELHASGCNVRSLVTLSFFSSAKENKDSTFGVNLFSRADELFLFIGLNCFSYATKVFIFFGLNALSYSIESMLSIIGMNIMSKSCESAFVLAGVNVFVFGEDCVDLLFGINLFSFSKHSVSIILFGANLFSFSKEKIMTLIGTNMFCKAKGKSYLGFGIPLFMNIGGESELSWEKAKENL